MKSVKKKMITRATPGRSLVCDIHTKVSAQENESNIRGAYLFRSTQKAKYGN